jgi:hypothetical protein
MEKQMARIIYGYTFLTLSLVLFAGCATAPPPVSILYSPSVETRGGAGSLFLNAVTKHPTRNNVDQGIRFVIGKQMDSYGMITGEILSVNSEEDMMLDATRRELTAAGYSVESGTSMPRGVTKGLDLTAIQVELDETASIPKIEAAGTVKVSMDVWKNGVVVKKLSYESKVSETSIINRDTLPREIIEKGLRGVLSQAVPDIISVLELKPAN